MATQLIENLSSEFDPSKYTDDYHDNLMKIIKAKMKGKKIEVAEAEEPEGTKVVDLIARLQESLELGRRAAEGSKSEGGETHKRAAKHAKRTTKRKTA